MNITFCAKTFRAECVSFFFCIRKCSFCLLPQKIRIVFRAQLSIFAFDELGHCGSLYTMPRSFETAEK